MKTKLVLWATKATAEQSDEKVLVALELQPDENKVISWFFEGASATDELAQQLLGAWRKGEAVAFPENTIKAVQELSAGASLLPETLRTEKDDLLKRSQTEWLFLVLSSKLFRSYEAELQELQDKVVKLEYYSKPLWDEMKAFWDKVQTQINEQNLLREHSELLRERTNGLFADLKQLRSVEDAAFETEAKQHHEKLSARLAPIEKDIADGKGDSFQTFEALKAIQNDFRKAKLTRALRSELWDRIDNAFKNAKNKRAATPVNPAQEGRLGRRIEGLREAIGKMDDSIQRDQKELDFQTQKIGSNNATQLETQLREVRAKLIQERIESKRVKLNDMKKTLSDLETRENRLQQQLKKQQQKQAEAAAKTETPAVVETVEEKAPEAEAPAAEETSAPSVENFRRFTEEEITGEDA